MYKVVQGYLYTKPKPWGDLYGERHEDTKTHDTHRKEICKCNIKLDEHV